MRVVDASSPPKRNQKLEQQVVQLWVVRPAQQCNANKDNPDLPKQINRTLATSASSVAMTRHSVVACGVSAKLPLTLRKSALVPPQSILSKLTLDVVSQVWVMTQGATTPAVTMSCLIACIVSSSKLGSHSFSSRCNSIPTRSIFSSASRACFLASSALSFACWEQPTACKTACR
jgi:hypothetical protein